MKISTLVLTLLFPILVLGQSFKIYDEITIPELNRKYQIGREYPEGYKIFVYNNAGKLFKIKEGLDTTNQANMSPSYLIVRTLDKNNKVLKNNILKDNDIDTEQASFSVKYIGIRKFIIIQNRFSFAILNLSNNKLIFPKCSYKDRPDVEIEDTQTFNICSIKVFDDGQYLVCSIGDFGIFCFNLSDIYNPVSVKGYYIHPPFSSPNFLFIDHRKDNIYNGICVKNTIRNIDNIDYLFKGFRFEQQDNDSIKKYELDKQYLLLKQYDKEDKVVNLVIDYKNGRLLDSDIDKDLINNLLNKINK